jgi:hypothetical protein
MEAAADAVKAADDTFEFPVALCDVMCERGEAARTRNLRALRGNLWCVRLAQTEGAVVGGGDDEGAINGRGN